MISFSFKRLNLNIVGFVLFPFMLPFGWDGLILGTISSHFFLTCLDSFIQ